MGRTHMSNQSYQPQTGGFSYGSSLAADRQRVLRNTYALLALSLIPTVLGAWIGVATGVVVNMSPMISMLVFFAGAFGLMFVIEKTKNSSMGVVALLGFTFFMGLMMSRLLVWTLGFKNGPSLIMMAGGGTATIFFAMAALATVVKRDLSGLQKFLFVGAVIAMIAGIANVFLQSTGVHLALLVAVLGIFSAFLLVDVKRIIDGGETNYISATLNIYLDLYNVFTALLQLLGIFGGDRE